MKIRPEKQLSLFSASAADNADRAPLRFWIDEGDPWADNFACGGGVSQGLKALCEQLGLARRGPDVAVNHDARALAMHEANHPECTHYCENIIKFDPTRASHGRRYALAWFSPTCIYFSQAKGGPLDASALKIRGLAWMACSWAASPSRPRVICLENVPPFADWGPLHKQHNNGCSTEYAVAHAKTRRDGSSVPRCSKHCSYMRPIKARKGELFRAFTKRLGTYYKYVSYRIMKAHHFGAPTSRARLVLIASDRPVDWPEPTYGPGKIPYRTAADCIDWSIECPSIFERSKPYTAATMRRIAVGLTKYVLESPRPFFAPIDSDARRHRDVGLLMAPFLIHCSNGERPGQTPRTYDVQKPLGTIVGDVKHALVVAYLAKGYSERDTGGWNGGSAVDAPIGSITARDHHSLVAAFLVKYYGTSTAQGADEPIHTITGSNRGGTHHALVTVIIDGDTYVVVDIGMRKLTARELFNCQGFPPDYQIAPIFNGKPLGTTTQVACVGNSVPPQLATAVAGAALMTVEYARRAA